MVHAICEDIQSICDGRSLITLGSQTMKEDPAKRKGLRYARIEASMLIPDLEDSIFRYCAEGKGPNQSPYTHASCRRADSHTHAAVESDLHHMRKRDSFGYS